MMRESHSMFLLLLAVSVQWTFAIDKALLQEMDRIISKQQVASSGVITPSIARIKRFIQRELAKTESPPPGQISSSENSSIIPGTSFASPFIVGGVDISIGSVPYLGSLQVDVNNPRGSNANKPLWFHVCGANLISDRWLLTAAHCLPFFDIANHRIRLGVGKLNGPENEGQAIPISSAVEHPDFVLECAIDRKATCFPNDIGALRMARRAVLGPTVQPLRLASRHRRFLHNHECKLAGFGATEPLEVDNEKLLQIDTSIISNDVCNCNFLFHSQNAIFDGHLCRYDPAEKGSACFGDSGSAIVCRKRGSKRPGVMASLVSWGDEECRPILPNVDTRISFHCNWIRHITGIPKRCGY